MLQHNSRYMHEFKDTWMHFWQSVQDYLWNLEILHHCSAHNRQHSKGMGEDFLPKIANIYLD